MKPKLLIPFFLSLCSAGFLYADSIEATVTSIDRDTREFTLESIQSEGETAHLSPLIVTVGAGDAQLHYQGKRIRGELGNSDGKYLLETIVPVYPDEEKTMASVNLQLQMDTAVRQRRQFRKEDDYGINFSMFNQNGEIVQWNQYKGDWILMNFIFTRCRMPKMCPAQTARMIDLQRHAKSVGIGNLQQVSVSFDPAYDTPGILFDYATSRGADLSTFHFLTGPKEVMLNVLKQYGVIAFDSKNIIDHTVTTLLFDKTGKIVLRRDGTEWSENDFVQHILDAEVAEAATAKQVNIEDAGSKPDSARDDASGVRDPESDMRPIILGVLLGLALIAAGVWFVSKRK